MGIVYSPTLSIPFGSSTYPLKIRICHVRYIHLGMEILEGRSLFHPMLDHSSKMLILNRIDHVRCIYQDKDHTASHNRYHKM